MKTIKRISPPLTTLEFSARAYDTRLEVSGDGGTSKAFLLTIKH